ncbi:MAG: hypothetical protein ABJB74_20025 [Gemmatimonas sp.]
MHVQRRLSMTANRFTLLSAALTAALLVVTSTTVVAQGDALGGMGGDGLNTRPFKIVIDGGLTLPKGDVKNLNENGFHLGASVIYGIPGLRVAVRPEFTLGTVQFRQNGLAQQNLDGKNYTRIVTGIAHIELPFQNGLYAFGGVGGVNLRTVLARDTTQRRGTDLMMDVGAGYRFEFGPIQSFFEMRYGMANTDKQKFTYSRFSMIPLSFGFVF